MVVVPRDKITELDELVKRYPGSRIVTKQCQLYGKSYLSIQSSNLDLLCAIASRYPENQDPEIGRL